MTNTQNQVEQFNYGQLEFMICIFSISFRMLSGPLAFLLAGPGFSASALFL